MQEGARLVTGGKALTDGEYARGHFFAPTLFDQVKPTMRIAKEEIFGPVLGVIEVKDLEEAIAVNNSVEYGLSTDRKSTRLNSSHGYISYAVFCLKKKKTKERSRRGHTHTR